MGSRRRAALLAALLIGFLLAWPVRAPAPPDAAPGTRWYFAEGTTLPGWSPVLHLLNPFPGAAAVTVSYLIDDGRAVPPSRVLLAGLSRFTIDVASEAGNGHTGVAMVVESTAPIVAERTVAFTADVPGLGTISGIHAASGLASARTSWFFAEGSTLPGFRPYVTLLNPEEVAALVTVTYAVEGGAPRARQLSVAPRARATIDVAADLATEAPGVAIRIESTTPVVAERPIYVARRFGGRGMVTGATIGAPAAAPAARWDFAEGSTLDSFAEFVTLLNPGTDTASVALDYRLENGLTATRSCHVLPRSRLTVTVFDPTLPCGIGRDLANGSLGEGVALTVRVVSGSFVVAERPVYFNLGGVVGAHSALGADAGAKAEYVFADGTTRDGWRTYWTVDNESGAPLTLDITYFRGVAPTVRTLLVPPRSRATVDASDHVGAGVDFGARLTSREATPFRVERPMYGPHDGTVTAGVAL